MTRPVLTTHQRGILLDLIAQRPAETCDEIAQAFEARTGRRVTRSWVWQIRRRGYKGPGGRSLTPLQRATLEGLCLQTVKTDPPATIAERFEQRTGRKVAVATVYDCLSRLGISRKKGGSR